MGRRSDILYWKVRKDEKDYGVEGQRASRFVMFKDEGKFFLFGSPREWEANTFRGMPVIWATPLGGTFIGQVRSQILKRMRNILIIIVETIHDLQAASTIQLEGTSLPSGAAEANSRMAMGNRSYLRTTNTTTGSKTAASRDGGCTHNFGNLALTSFE